MSSANCNEKQFEFVAVDAPGLAARNEAMPDPSSFSRPLSASSSSWVAVFPNLSGDARLVVPKKAEPSLNDATYSHLAAFVRGAPKKQVLDFWQTGAQEYDKFLTDRQSKQTVWLNTAGGGVSWLHLRLDSVPKYYKFKPFALET